MQAQRNRPVSGHVFLAKRKRGDQWYVKYRLPDGRQVQRRLGPAHTGGGRPLAGTYTRRTAQAALDAILTDARRGTLAGMVQSGATFADAAEEWLRYVKHDRGRKPSTVRSYRSCLDAHLLPAFGHLQLEQVTPGMIERWRTTVPGSDRTRNKLLIALHGIFRRAARVYGLRANPAAEIEKQGQRPSGAFDVFSPEEVLALVRAAEYAQDGAIYLTAAFTGLRMGELLALRWRDVDFDAETIRVQRSYTQGVLGTPNSGLVRPVPMVPAVAEALAKLGQRGQFTGDDDLVFVGVTGEYLDASALRRRFKTALKDARLRELRFHDLRHTFGSLAINRASIVQVQAWMGHSNIATTQKYLHHKSRADEARLLADAFTVTEAAAPS